MCLIASPDFEVASSENEIKKIIGAWYRRHRTDASLWPKKLYAWVEANKPEGGTLQQSELLAWMALETGFNRLTDPDIIRLYGNMERWAGGKDFRSSYNPVIYAATINTAFLTFPIGGDRVTDPMVIVRVLEGEADPFSSQTPSWY